MSPSGLGVSAQPSPLALNTQLSYDANIDYAVKIKDEQLTMQRLQTLPEESSQCYLESLNRVIVAEDLFSKRVHANRDLLLQMKRDEKLSAKEIKQIAKLHKAQIPLEGESSSCFTRASQ